MSATPFRQSDLESDPILSALNSDQQAAVLTLLSVVTASQAEREAKRGGWAALLTGPAGSGKTFTLAALIKFLVRQNQVVNRLLRARGISTGAKPERFRVLTPTHQAKRVVLDALTAHGVPSTQVVAQTVAAFLAKRPDVENPPPQSNRPAPGFVANPSSSVEALQSDIAIIVDEVSMLSAPDVRSIKVKAHDAGIAVLFTGDFEQIPPVGHPSIARHIATIGTHVHLHRVERNRGDILRIATEVRETGDFDPDAYRGSDTVTIYTDADKWLAAYCRHSDEPVGIAYRNVVVNALADRRRRSLLGVNNAEHPFIVGETFTLASPVMAETRGPNGLQTTVSVLPSSARVLVQSIRSETTIVDPISGLGVPAVDLTVKPRDLGELTPAGWAYFDDELDPTNGDCAIDILAITPRTRDSDTFKRSLKARERVARYIQDASVTAKATGEIDISDAPNGLLAALDLSRMDYEKRQVAGAGGATRTVVYPNTSSGYESQRWFEDLRRWAWRSLYFGWSSQFVVLASPHARTAHTAQGSTYPVVFVHARDIRRAAGGATKPLLYVALSRASEHLHILT